MPFTATINSITPQDTGLGSMTYLTSVTFSDSTSGFSSTKTYSFPMNTTQASAVTTITADGNLLKSALAAAGNLQSKVGSVITI